MNGTPSLDRNSIKEASYNIGIQISQSSASLTKIVTFCPYFMVYNSADFNIEMKVRFVMQVFDPLIFLVVVYVSIS